MLPRAVYAVTPEAKCGCVHEWQGSQVLAGFAFLGSHPLGKPQS